jgi:predicted molibdopterin-dependent oxidoreductase YjgC
VRQSVPPVPQAKPDWVITSLLAKALGVDLNFQMSASAVFQELAKDIPAYNGLRYPLLRDESKPVQVQHPLAARRDLTNEAQTLRRLVENLDESTPMHTVTPQVGHELFVIGVLTGKTPEIHLLAAGNPEPTSVLVSPVYQITIDSNLRREEIAVAGD